MKNVQNQIVVGENLITYYKFGIGKEVLIFLHGWRSSSEAWFGVIKSLLTEKYTIYTLDLPGFGGSPSPNSIFSVDDYGDVVRSFMKKKQIDKAVLVGHSFGGRIAIKIAALSPEIVSQLVLVDSAGIKREHKTRKRIAKILKPLFAPSFMQNIRKSIYKSIGADDYVQTPELQNTYLKITSEDLTPYLKEIKADTLLIWGSDDRETPVEDGETMHKKIPGSELEIIYDAGHFSFIDNPREFSAIINKFLTK